MKKNYQYIQPCIKVFAVHPSRIMAASAIPVTENGDADAKRATFFFDDSDDDDADYSW